MTERDTRILDDLESLKLRDDVGWQANIQTLVRLCYLAVGGDDYTFARRVKLLWQSLPAAVKDDPDVKRRLDDCTHDQPPEYQYRYFSGVPIGTPEHPVLNDDGSVVSPTLVAQPPVTDWDEVFELTIECLEELGVTWHPDAKGGGQ